MASVGVFRNAIAVFSRLLVIKEGLGPEGVVFVGVGLGKAVTVAGIVDKGEQTSVAVKMLVHDSDLT